LEAVREHQSQQEERIRALEAALAEARRTTAELAARTARFAAAEEAAEAEQRRLEGLSTAALLAEIRKRTKMRWGDDSATRTAVGAVLRMCEILLPRPLSAGERHETLLAKGVAARWNDDRASSESSLREALDRAGPATREGRSAAWELGNTAAWSKDHRAAAEWFLSIARQPESGAGERAHTRFIAASHFAAAGDAARARDEYRSVADEFGASEDATARHYAGQSRKALESMDADAAAGRSR
jgi:hypothetical protein